VAWCGRTRRGRRGREEEEEEKKRGRRRGGGGEKEEEEQDEILSVLSHVTREDLLSLARDPELAPVSKKESWQASTMEVNG
jgi:hypothetical protein